MKNPRKRSFPGVKLYNGASQELEVAAVFLVTFVTADKSNSGKCVRRGGRTPKLV